MADSDAENEDLPIKTVKHFVGARLISVGRRDSLSSWSAVFSFASIIGSVLLAYVGWSTCGNYSLFMRLARGYDGSFIPWLAGIIGTIMATIFLLGTLVCTVTATTYLRVRLYHVLNAYLYTLLACLLTIVLFASLTGLHLTLLSSKSKGSLTDSMNRYNNDTAIRSTIDRLQIDLKCCGSVSYMDWWNTQWYPLDYVDRNSPEVQAKMHGNKFLTDDVPFSCCNPEVLRPCVHHAMKDMTLHYNYISTEVTVYTVGCADALNTYFTHVILLNIAYATISILFTLMPLLFIFRYLQTSTVKSITEDEPYKPARGYLWIRREIIRPKSHKTDKKDPKKKKKKKAKASSSKKSREKNKKKEISGKKSEKTDSDESNGDSSDASDKSEAKRRRHKKRQHHKSKSGAPRETNLIDGYGQSQYGQQQYYQSNPYNPYSSASYGPSYVSPSDAYSKYYANYYQSLVSQQPNNNSEPNGRPDVDNNDSTIATAVKDVPSDDIYDVIDSEHQTDDAAEQSRLDEGKKRSASIRDELHHPAHHTQTPKVIQIDNGKTGNDPTEVSRQQSLEQVPSDDIYDEIGPVGLQSAKDGPEPPPIRRQRTTNHDESTLPDDAKVESVYLEPQEMPNTKQEKQKTSNRQYQNLPGATKKTKSPKEDESAYLLPHTVKVDAPRPPPTRRPKTANNVTVDKSTLPYDAMVESVYLEPQEMPNTKQEKQKTSNRRYQNLPGATKKNKSPKGGETEYLLPHRVKSDAPKPPPMRRPKTANHDTVDKSILPYDAQVESVYLEPQEIMFNIKQKSSDKHYQNLPDATKNKKSREEDESEYLLPETNRASSVAPVINKTQQIGQESEYLLPQLPPESDYLMPQLPPESEYLIPQFSPGSMEQSSPTYANINRLATVNNKTQPTNSLTNPEPASSRKGILNGNSSLLPRTDRIESVYLEPRIVYRDRTPNTETFPTSKPASKPDNQTTRQQLGRDRTVPPAPPPLRQPASAVIGSVRTPTNVKSSGIPNSVYEPLHSFKSDNSTYQDLADATGVIAQPLGIYESLRSKAVSNPDSSVRSATYEKLRTVGQPSVDASK